MDPSLFGEMTRVENRHWWFTGRNAILRAVLRRFVGRREDRKPRLVEPGCGTGVNLERFRAEGFEVCGFDASEVAVATCTQRGLDVREARVEGELPFAAESFDVLLLPDVLEHFADDAAALASTSRLLRPGGMALITVPAGPSMWSQHDELHHHRRRYRKSELTRLVETAGLKLELISHYNSLLYPLAWLQRKVMARLRPEPEPADAASLLRVPAAGINAALRAVFAFERHLIGRLALPFGLSLIAVARKPLDDPAVAGAEETETPTSADPWSGRRSITESVVLAMALLYTCLAHFAHSLFVNTTQDATLFAYAGKLIRQGLIPYRDFWDNKPPGIFYTEALALRLFGDSWVAPTLLQLIFYCGTVMLLWRFGRQVFPGTAGPRIAFLLMVTFMMNLPKLVEGGNLTETYMLLPVMACVVAMRPFDTPTLGRWIHAGAWAAVAFLYRPTAVALGAVALAVLLFHPKLAGRRLAGILRLGASFAAGVALVLLAVTAFMASLGQAGEMWFATLGYNLGAYKETLPPPSYLDLDRYIMFKTRHGLWAPYACFLLVAVTTLLAWRRRRLDRDRLLRVIVVGAWILADGLLALITGRPYGHYMLSLVISAALGASLIFDGVGMGRCLASPGRARAFALVALVVLSMGWLRFAKEMPGLMQQGARTAFAEDLTPDQLIARELAARVSEGERVMIWGHGQGPVFYLGNPPVVPLLSTVHLRSQYSADRWGPLYVQALLDAPPRYVIVTDRISLFESEGSGPDVEIARQIRDLLEEKYRSVVTGGHPHRVFELRSQADE